MATKTSRTAKTATVEAPEAPKDGVFAESARDIAEHAASLLSQTNEALDELTDHAAAAMLLPVGSGDSQTADAVRRLPMAVDEVRRALGALTTAATDLARQAAQ